MATLSERGTMATMQFGRSYEEFEVGAVYKLLSLIHI